MVLTSLYNDDARNVLKNIPSESVDCVCSDVPYSTTTRGNTGSMGGYWTSDLVSKGCIFENNLVYSLLLSVSIMNESAFFEELLQIRISTTVIPLRSHRYLHRYRQMNPGQ